jgi:O-antigen/teichoic acid export membrane protein
MPSAEPPVNLSREAVHGSLWVYLAFVSGKLLSFVTTVILARLLLPEQFGLVGYCLIAFQYLSLLNLFGMDVALISRRDKLQEAANAAFLGNIATGALLFGVAWVAAPSIAAFFKAPAVTPLFRALALSLPLGALGAVPDALLQRALRFKARLLPEFGRSIVKGIISVFFAWRGFGVWSLVLGHIGGEVMGTASAWVLAGWRPTLSFDSRVAREMTVFGVHIVAIGLLGALFSNVDFLFVGRILGAEALGYYTLAYRIPELVLASTNNVVARVAHPLFSRVQSSAEQLRITFISYLRYMSLIIFPAGVGLAIVTAPFIIATYPPRWAPSIPAMQLISLALAVSSIGFIPGVLYKASNRPEILTKLALVKLLPDATILWLGTHWGITGVAAAQIVTAFINVSLDVLVVSRILHLRPIEILRALGPATACSATMGLAGFFLAPKLTSAGVPGLLFLIVFGIIVYGTMLLIVSRGSITQAGKVLLASRRS